MAVGQDVCHRVVDAYWLSKHLEVLLVVQVLEIGHDFTEAPLDRDANAAHDQVEAILPRARLLDGKRQHFRRARARVVDGRGPKAERPRAEGEGRGAAAFDRAVAPHPRRGDACTGGWGMPGRRTVRTYRPRAA